MAIIFLIVNVTMEIASALQRVLTKPDPADLLQLQAALLSLETTVHSAEQKVKVASALAVLDDFYGYMVDLEGKLEAHAFAELASKLDIGAVGGVVLDNILSAGDRILQRILIGGLSEALMVLASRQYIKAYNRELNALHRQTAWRARAHLWRFSAMTRPELPAKERTDLVDALLKPVFSNDTPAELKLVLLGRLYQVLILCFVTACGPSEAGSAAE